MRVAGGKAALLVLGVLPALAGCSTYTDPRLDVTRARVVERTDAGVVIDFFVDATNPNEVPLPLREVRYTLELDGKPVFTGFRSPESTIRRFGTQPITLPAVVRAEDAGGLSAGTAVYRLSGTLTYTTPGEIEEILFDNSIRRPTVSFADEGTLSAEGE